MQNYKILLFFLAREASPFSAEKKVLIGEDFETTEGHSEYRVCYRSLFYLRRCICVVRTAVKTLLVHVQV